MISPENIHTSTIMWHDQNIFTNIYAYLYSYMQAMTINEKRGHEFEGEQRAIGDN